MSGFNDLFKGLANLIDLVQKMDAQGTSEVSKSGNWQTDLQGEKLQGVYGFSLKIGSPGQNSVKSFGNIKSESADLKFDSKWEPVVEIFDEGKEVLIVAEIPGVSEENVSITCEDKTLKLQAKGVQRTYHKEIALAEGFTEYSFQCRNGILEIRIPKG